MEKFLIEVPHGEDETACARVIKKFLDSGSHLLSNADWGCKDGVHKVWVVVEAGSKEEALMVLPPLFRPQAAVICLCKFTSKEIDDLLGIPA